MRMIPLENQKKISSLAFPILSLLVIIVLSLTLGKTLVLDLLENRSAVSDLQKSNTIISSKINSISILDQNLISQNADLSLTAFPTENSSLPSLVTIKSFAIQDLVEISGFKVGTGVATGKSPSSTVSASFEIKGQITNINQFLADIESALPLIQINKISLTNSGVLPVADLSLSSFWAKLPASLPPANTPFQNLTQSQKEVLAKLGKFKIPNGSSIVPLPAAGKENPFSFQ